MDNMVHMDHMDHLDHIDSAFLHKPLYRSMSMTGCTSDTVYPLSKQQIFCFCISKIATGCFFLTQPQASETEIPCKRASITHRNDFAHQEGFWTYYLFSANNRDFNSALQKKLSLINIAVCFGNFYPIWEQFLRFWRFIANLEDFWLVWGLFWLYGQFPVYLETFQIVLKFPVYLETVQIKCWIYT